MKILVIGTTALWAILAFSTTVCGLWLRFAAPKPVAQSSIDFHVYLALITMAFSVVTMIVLVKTK